jgi:hypothetical protein
MIKVTRRAGFSLFFMLPFSGTAAARMARRNNNADNLTPTAGEGRISGALGKPQATLSALRAANIADRVFLYDAALWTWTLGDYTGQMEDGSIVKADGAPLSAGAWVRQPAEGVTYKAAARGARVRPISSKLDETALSVMDFMTPAQANSVRQRQSTMDCTDAINTAFVHAQNTGRTVYFPDGVYLVGNLIFGTQSDTGGSSTPLGLQGQSKIGTVLRAKPGLTGTLLKSRSCAGVTFSDFTIETIGTSAQAWDCAWKAGAGPSTQNVIQNILVTGGTAPLHVDWNDLNDTYPTGVTVRVDDPTARSCGISAVQSGGLSAMHGCIWSGCYLRFGAQNGKLDTCWGHGIEFATGCLNYVEISACYIYANSTHGALLWSQSFSSYQSIRALTCTATQFITLVSNVPVYFNVNAYSTMRFTGCQWIGPTSRLLGKTSRTDSYSNVLVRIDGGAHTGHLILQDIPGFDIECEGFMNDSTGRMVTKTRSGTFIPVVRGGSGREKYAGGREIYGRYHRQGNLVFFKLRLQWSRYSGPLEKDSLQITGFPLEVEPLGASSVSIEYWGGSHTGQIRPTFSDGIVNFFSIDGSPVASSPDGDIILSGFYSVKA